MLSLEELEALQESEVAAMFDSMEGGSQVVEPEPNKVDPEPVVEPVTKEVQTEPSTADLEIEPVPVPVVEKESDVKEPSVEEILRQQIQELTAKLSAPVQQIYPAQQAVVPAAKIEEPTQTQQQQTAPVVTQEGFVPGTYLTDEELDRVIDDPRLIVEAIKRAQQDVLKQMSGQLGSYQQTINQQVQQAVQQQLLVTKAITDFYDANQDLRPYAQFTQYVLAEVEQKALGQNKTYGEIFEDTAKEARKRLGLPNPAVQTIERGKVVDQKPAFAGSKKGGTARPAETKQIFDKNAADILALEEL